MSDNKRTLILWVRPKEWEKIGKLSAWEVEESLKAKARLNEVWDSYVMTYPPDKEPFRPTINDEELSTAGLNNCFFKTETIIEHDDLRFRSPAEVAIYDELKQQKLLFFPNPAAVLGGDGRKREPDFLICHKGKWGFAFLFGKMLSEAK